MRRIAVILLLLLVGCGIGRKVEILRLDTLHTEHLRRLDAGVTVRSGFDRAVELRSADAVIMYRGRRMCRIELSEPVNIAARSISQVSLAADMEIYDMAAVSAFSRLYARDSVKALSFVRIKGRASVKIGTKERKIKL